MIDTDVLYRPASPAYYPPVIADVKHATLRRLAPADVPMDGKRISAPNRTTVAGAPLYHLVDAAGTLGLPKKR